MKHIHLGILLGLTCASAIGFGQEFTPTIAPPTNGVVVYKNNFESGIDAIGATIEIPQQNTAQIETYQGSKVLSIVEHEPSVLFWFPTLPVPGDHVATYIEVDFDVRAEAGFQNSLDLWCTNAPGPVGNRSTFVIPDAAMTSKIHVHFRCILDQVDPSNHAYMILGPSPMSQPVGGGNFNGDAKIFIDNFRITYPKRLAGVTKVTGTTDKNLGAITFSNDGTTLGTYTDWYQNIGSKEMLDVYGRSNFGFDSNAVSGSNMLFREPSQTGYQALSMERYNGALSTIANTAWIGTQAVGGTDRYYGVQVESTATGQQYLFRQNSNNGVYTHFVRCLSDTFYYGHEVPVDLGGEELVAVGDFNGDSKDDFVTRSGNNLKVRYFVANTGSNPDKGIQVSDPTTATNQGFLKCLAVNDIDGNGHDDLLVVNENTGDTFGLFFDNGAATLKWLFQLGQDGTEYFLGLADADNDGLPEVYTSRETDSNGQREVDLRKFDVSSVSTASMTSINYLFSYNVNSRSLCAVGDINGDGSADLVSVGSDALNTLRTYLVDPSNHRLLGSNANWITNARSTNLKPIFN